VGILDRGRLVALDTPDALRGQLGGDTITIQCEGADALTEQLRTDLECTPQVVDQTIRLEQPPGAPLLTTIVQRYADQVRSITLARPTLEDVFIARTGHHFEEEATEEGSSV
jgi:ABC-2 type transport system ATP-binding protein